MTQETVEKVVIFFAGDSGDGIQLAGSQFTNTAALYGNDLSTFPDFPAEIRAPQGTLAGVSGFQISFGSTEIFTPGDECDVLVVMNVAALKANLKRLKKGGAIIVNTDGFDKRNLRLAGFEDGENPLSDNSLSDYRVSEMNVTKLTRECLVDITLGIKEKDRCKNMFVLGFVYWMYNRTLEHTIEFLTQKFRSKPEVLESNIKVLKAGYNFANTCEISSSRFEVKPAKMSSGTYRNIMGNQATAMGLIAASQQSGLELFYGSYPITPASDILHELAKHKNFGVKSFQAEDEIAAVSAAIGASFGGALGVTATSGPGVALKGEAIGLAFMLELPLVIVNVQRGGPSTGLPTKTEQADLLQAMYGRNGEAPIPVVSASTPSDCFEASLEACRIAIEHMTPVFFLSDGYIANGAEPWMFPQTKDLKGISVPMTTKTDDYLPYKRDEKLVREWAIPGMAGLEHRLGGLEKEAETGNVSYDSDNHEYMVKTRAEKVERIADFIPLQNIDSGEEKGKVLVLAWGSTYGAVKTAVKELLVDGFSVSHAHLRYINPLPKNLGELLSGFDKVLIPEINNGQLIKIIRDKFLIDAIPFNKIKGTPFEAREIKNRIIELHDGK
ncbi:2-oxoacid:acceptor oxidoreductase subunit alpha [Flavobacteriales bacterium]|jgi:2-oxoglutarate/2-oxoacid ferredoxin oxidoreductase subunit alpha|nr:2-oxoacid:acceptor oxidoreductase subunit alpha [Flavobacteriales bacterium]MDB2362227.1 2-oxoacid:acceptor oxidoreductase subunit alpha [Flavobacteriales bacterium]